MNLRKNTTKIVKKFTFQSILLTPRKKRILYRASTLYTLDGVLQPKHDDIADIHSF